MPTFSNASVSLETLPLADLTPHPDNPRLAPREDVIESITAGLANGFDPAHALIVRPLNGGFQILAGHHRALAAKRVKLREVPCWVRNLDDDEAYMLLATSNAQSELSPLEIGIHAYKFISKSEGGRGKKSGQSEYGRQIGKSHNYVAELSAAGEVYLNAKPVAQATGLAENTKHLTAIKAAPSWLWPALVKAMLKGEWNVNDTREHVQRFKNLFRELKERPAWLDEKACSLLADGTMPVHELTSMAERLASAEAELEKLATEWRRLLLTGPQPDLFNQPNQRSSTEIKQEVAEAFERKFLRLSDLMAYYDTKLTTFRERLRKAQQALEDAETKAAHLRENVSLEQWQKLDEATRQTLLTLDLQEVKPGDFLKQPSADIE